MEQENPCPKAAISSPMYERRKSTQDAVGSCCVNTHRRFWQKFRQHAAGTGYKAVPLAGSSIFLIDPLALSTAGGLAQRAERRRSRGHGLVGQTPKLILILIPQDVVRLDDS